MYDANYLFHHFPQKPLQSKYSKNIKKILNLYFEREVKKDKAKAQFSRSGYRQFIADNREEKRDKAKTVQQQGKRQA